MYIAVCNCNKCISLSAFLIVVYDGYKKNEMCATSSLIIIYWEKNNKRNTFKKRAPKTIEYDASSQLCSELHSIMCAYLKK